MKYIFPSGHVCEKVASRMAASANSAFSYFAGEIYVMQTTSRAEDTMEAKYQTCVANKMTNISMYIKKD